jgi:AraC-like DNA-binding protein
VFEIRPKEITDGYLDLTLLKKAKDFNLQEQLLNAASLNDCLTKIDQFILRSVNEKLTSDDKIIFATREIRNSKGLYSLVDLQDNLNITERTFQRLFENHVGLSPNMYRRICQFQFSFQKINQNNFFKLTNIAYDSGFADQSHFIRVFREFTGLTPNQYLAQIAPYNPQF